MQDFCCMPIVQESPHEEWEDKHNCQQEDCEDGADAFEIVGEVQCIDFDETHHWEYDVLLDEEPYEMIPEDFPLDAVVDISGNIWRLKYLREAEANQFEKANNEHRDDYNGERKDEMMYWVCLLKATAIQCCFAQVNFTVIVHVRESLVKEVFEEV